jgi:hypothetical protein
MTMKTFSDFSLAATCYTRAINSNHIEWLIKLCLESQFLSHRNTELQIQFVSWGRKVSINLQNDINSNRMRWLLWQRDPFSCLLRWFSLLQKKKGFLGTMLPVIMVGNEAHISLFIFRHGRFQFAQFVSCMKRTSTCEPLQLTKHVKLSLRFECFSISPTFGAALSSHQSNSQVYSSLSPPLLLLFAFCRTCAPLNAFHEIISVCIVYDEKSP